MVRKQKHSSWQSVFKRIGEKEKLLPRLRKVFLEKVNRQRVLMAVSFLLMVAILQIDLVPKTIQVELGQPSPDKVEAPRTVINAVKTEELQEEAAAKALEEALPKPEFQIISAQARNQAVALVSGVFAVFDSARGGRGEEPPAERELEHQIQRVRAELVVLKEEFTAMPPEEIKALLLMGDEDYDRVKKGVRQIFPSIQADERISPERIDELKKDLDRFLLTYPLLPQDHEPARALLSAMLFPNLVPDQAKLYQVQEEAKKKVTAVTIEKGSVILREGEIVTSEHIRILRDLGFIDNQGNRLLIFFSLALFSLFILGIGFFYLYRFHKKILQEENLLYLLTLVILVVLATAKIMSLPDIPLLRYLIPLPFAGVILTILLNPQVAWVVTALLSLMTGVVADFNLSLAVFYSISGTIAIYSVTNITQRKEMIRTGVLLAGVNFCAAITVGLLFGERNFLDLFSMATVGCFNGIFSIALANGFLPFLEQLFRVTSALSLLELANPNMPLLKRLLIEAPGTYHHSIIMGNLAEAAADAIGADSILVRVGAYYHDIGKLLRPYFFVENQIAQDNPHEKLSPNLSTLIITSHVRDGVELARQYGIPESVIEIIEQHHGTDLLRYFFKRAAENVQEEKETLAEKDFRYPGPKPRSREAAIIMLADSVEAAARAMDQPTPSRLEALVDKIIQDRLELRQLDETDLTLKDLDKIKAAFLKVLTGIFHHRIKYPDDLENEAERKKLVEGNNQ
jgi:putative nucleotidyltransferase with HDIG domain